MRALAGANGTRLDRSAVKAQILAGETTVADVLREPPACAASMTIFDLLMSQERWGKSRTASAPPHREHPRGQAAIRQAGRKPHGSPAQPHHRRLGPRCVTASRSSPSA
jgi:hypothetical protein